MLLLPLPALFGQATLDSGLDWALGGISSAAVMLKMTLHSLRVTAFGGGNKYATGCKLHAAVANALGDARLMRN